VHVTCVGDRAARAAKLSRVTLNGTLNDTCWRPTVPITMVPYGALCGDAYGTRLWSDGLRPGGMGCSFPAVSL
jgi:hypothetical protein